MKEHKYRVTLEYIEDEEGRAVDAPPLVFEVANHDDILKILGMAEASGGAVAPVAKPLVVGLKLLADVCMRNRKTEPFASVMPAMREIVLALKGEIRKGRAP